MSHRLNSPAHLNYKKREAIRNRINRKLEYDECKKEGRCYRCFVLINEVKSNGKKPHACKNCRRMHDMRAKLRLIKNGSMAELADATDLKSVDTNVS